MSNALGHVAKWGDSLAVRLPDGVAEAARFVEGTAVEIALDGGRVVLTPVPPAPSTSPAYRLEDLLASITGDDPPPELFADTPRGSEAW